MSHTYPARGLLSILCRCVYGFAHLRFLLLPRVNRWGSTGYATRQSLAFSATQRRRYAEQGIVYIILFRVREESPPFFFATMEKNDNNCSPPKVLIYESFNHLQKNKCKIARKITQIWLASLFYQINMVLPLCSEKKK